MATLLRLLLLLLPPARVVNREEIIMTLILKQLGINSSAGLLIAAQSVNHRLTKWMIN